jgi:hypothetical protein
LACAQGRQPILGGSGDRAIRDQADKLTGFAKVTRDITERREAQARLEGA